MRPEWKDTYIIPVGHRMLEIDRPTGYKRTIEKKTLRHDVAWEKDERNRFRGTLNNDVG